MVKYMKKQFLYKVLFVMAILIFGACNDPIFYTISLEEKKLEPRIKGSPTNFAAFNSNMYVASGTEVYRYEGTNPGTGRGIWEETKPGGGNIFALAATDKLYALCAGSSGKKVLMVSNEGRIWNKVNELGNDIIINTIYAANNKLFIGAGGIGKYYILSGNDFTTKLIDTENKMLNGAAYHNGIYYLSTKDLITDNGGGIYSIEESALSTEASARLLRNGSFIGIINTGNVVLAITRNGNLHTVTPNSVDQVSGVSMGNRLATGALAVWENNGNRLLLAGRQDSIGTTITTGYSHGYIEAGIDINGAITGNFDEPGKNDLSTINKGDNERYRSSIGNYSSNHIFQAYDGTLFASTQKDGVWSYRDRSKGWSWNAEN
jgi:hypothetical protein